MPRRSTPDPLDDTTSVDATLKRRQAERVRRALVPLMAARGFRRTKPTIWVRERTLLIEYVHLHLFSHSPSFRVHCGLRMRNDEFSAAALNGVSSLDGRPELGFDASAGSVHRCTSEIEKFVIQCGEPWFARWRDLHALAYEEGSPLEAKEKATVREVLGGRLMVETSSSTRRCLGVV